MRFFSSFALGVGLGLTVPVVGVCAGLVLSALVVCVS